MVHANMPNLVAPCVALIASEDNTMLLLLGLWK